MDKLRVIRCWDIYAELKNGERRKLNQSPFVGDMVDATEEGDRLIEVLENVETVEYESLGFIREE